MDWTSTVWNFKFGLLEILLTFPIKYPFGNFPPNPEEKISSPIFKLTPLLKFSIENNLSFPVPLRIIFKPVLGNYAGTMLSFS